VILLDTHVVVWLAFDPSRLSRRAKAAMHKADPSGSTLNTAYRPIDALLRGRTHGGQVPAK